MNRTHLEAANNQRAPLPSEATVQLPRLMNQRDFANYVGKSTAWAERARWAGEGPRFVKLGRHVRYRAEDVLEWIEQNICTSTSEVQS